MPHKDPEEQELAEIEASLRNLDIEAARKLMPEVSLMQDEFILLILHKCRYEHQGIEPALRQESAEWLRSRGFSRIGGAPLLPPGQLPHDHEPLPGKAH